MRVLGKPWSKDELAALIGLAPFGVHVCSDALPGRTKAAIRQKTAHIGIKLKRVPRGDLGASWRGRIPIPKHCHPLVKGLFEVMNREKVLLREVAERIGSTPCMLTDWRYRTIPRLDNFEAALNSLGLRLVIGHIRESDQ